nr:probable calcium-binding protein CML45 [Ipomoea batatas]GMD27493.1 probable calcium-binding protein CML45 [Ipomoea batatas]GMD29633.1 probable calcium-binding protein CML45 [Ipomoea batatas]
MELTAKNTNTATSSSILVTFFKFLHRAIRDAISSVLRSPQISINPSAVDEDAACSICMADVKVVMGRLGMAWEDDDEEEESERVVVINGGGEEEEASMGEVKRCFDVFDENGDGFIEACELQRVFVCLGLEEGCGLEDCKRMIWAFDENGDGVIDLGEFAKLMAQISI